MVCALSGRTGRRSLLQSVLVGVVFGLVALLLIKIFDGKFEWVYAIFPALVPILQNLWVNHVSGRKTNGAGDQDIS